MDLETLQNVKKEWKKTLDAQIPYVEAVIRFSAWIQTEIIKAGETNDRAKTSAKR
ncbi:MAG: hypothetical protein Q8O88_00885 [bacterium]|nr:hypothetical protein [bacterium]